MSAEDATEILLTRGFDFQQKLLETEREMITKALAQTNGRVTHAAGLLGLSYQALSYIIDTRHKDLLKARSPVRRRKRKIHQETRTAIFAWSIPAILLSSCWASICICCPLSAQR